MVTEVGELNNVVKQEEGRTKYDVKEMKGNKVGKVRYMAKKEDGSIRLDHFNVNVSGWL